MVRALIVLSVACITYASSAAAEQSVELAASECVTVPYDHASLVELLRVELGALGITRIIAAGETRTASIRLSIAPAGCDANTGELVLGVERAGTRGVTERRMPLSDIPIESRSRALAIALAELLGEPVAAPAPPSAIPARPAVDPQHQTMTPPSHTHSHPERPPSAASAPWLGGGAILRTFPSAAVSALGVELYYALPIARELRLSFGADAQTGTAGPPQRSTSVGAVTASVGASWMFGSEIQLALGPRLHVGYGWAKDAFFTNDDSEHLVVMGALAGTTHFGLDRDVIGHVGLELGAGLLDAAISDAKFVDRRGVADEIGVAIELGVRLGVDFAL